MKLLAPKLEMNALFNICEGAGKIQGHLFASLSEQHFAYAPTRDGYRRALALAQSSGSIPSWDSICHDTSISEENRTILLSYTALLTKSKSKVDELVNQLHMYHKVRAVNSLIESSYEALSGEKCDVDELITNINNGVSSISANAKFEDFLFNIGQGNNSTHIVKKLLDDSKPSLVPTGFDVFDSKNGGIYDGSMFLIAGTTGGGKSTLAIQLLRNMSQHEDVVLVPFEMTAEESMARLMSNLSGVPLSKILQKKISSAEKRVIQKAYMKYRNDLKARDLKFSIFSPDEDMSMDEVLFFLRPYKYKVILIDYVSLLKGVDGDDAWQALGRAARQGKIFAKNNHCIVILLAQLSEEGQVRYARSLVEHANNAWSFVVTEESRAEGILDVHSIKARNQMLFNFQLKVESEIMRIYDIDLADAPDTDSDSATASNAKTEYLKDATEIGDEDD